jgi:hypothetical protein
MLISAAGKGFPLQCKDDGATVPGAPHRKALVATALRG